MTEVPMPADDGASFLCNLNVPKDPPVFWDRCNEPAVAAYKQTGTRFLALRCKSHRGMEKYAEAS